MPEPVSTVKQNVTSLLSELPEGVQLVAAAKGRAPEAVLEAVEAGVAIIGENYVQEAELAQQLIGHRAEWHFIGHLQKNKVKKAVAIFDMLETIDSIELASEIDRRCAQASRSMPVLIEVNIGREAQKTGVFPEATEPLVRKIALLSNVRVMGLMTMGPRAGNGEECRPYFAETRRLFERLRALHLPTVQMKHLSMGMSNSYRVAIQEGANMVRIGSRIFGDRA